MGSKYQDERNHIDREEYKKAYNLICFDLSPDLDEGGGYVNLKKIASFIHGALRKGTDRNRELCRTNIGEILKPHK